MTDRVGSDLETGKMMLFGFILFGGLFEHTEITDTSDIGFVTEQAGIQMESGTHTISF